jgi:hypothetical protein
MGLSGADAGHLLVAAALTYLLGFERDLRGAPGGDRVFALVGLGSGVMGIIAAHGAPNVLAGAITGIGFIGGGLVFWQALGTQQVVMGVTTAAAIFAAAGSFRTTSRPALERARKRNRCRTAACLNARPVPLWRARMRNRACQAPRRCLGGVGPGLRWPGAAIRGRRSPGGEVVTFSTPPSPAGSSRPASRHSPNSPVSHSASYAPRPPPSADTGILQIS